MGKKPAKEIAIMGMRGFPHVQGGVERHCEALYPLMSGRNFNVYRRKPFLTPESNATTYPNIRFTDLPSTRVSGVEATVHTLLSALHAGFSRPALVHIHNIGPGLFIPLLRLMGLKVVMTYHSSNYEHEKWGPVARRILRLAEKLSVRWTNRVIFVNRRLYDKISPLYPDKCLFLPNGVTSSGPTAASNLLERHGVTPGSYILAVGRLTPEKGFEHLVEAVNQLSDPNVRLVIAGGSDNDNAYLNLLKSKDIHHRVIFTGNVYGEELNQLYSHARLYVLSSVNEGFPLVLLEAMDHRLPIIVTDIPATHLPQVPAGAFVPAADAPALARAIAQYLEQNPELQRVDYDLTDYDWQKIAEQTDKVYASLID